MILILGLGNPGEKYRNTRHNAGFIFLDEIREFLGWDNLYQVGDWDSDATFHSQLCSIKVDGEKRILLAKPTTFMNSSGIAARKLVRKNSISVLSDFILVHDDLDLKLGSYKIQRAKAPRVHNGVNSVQSHLATLDFLRIRIGIDNRDPSSSIPGDEYVLGRMSEEEVNKLREASLDAIKNLRSVLKI